MRSWLGLSYCWGWVIRISSMKCTWSYTVFGMWWHTVTHGRGNWRMEWVASTLTRPRDVVYPALLTLMRTPRLPAVDWTDSPYDLNGLVRLGERRNPVSARVPSGSARALTNIRCASSWYTLCYMVRLKHVNFREKSSTKKGVCKHKYTSLSNIKKHKFIGIYSFQSEC